MTLVIAFLWSRPAHAQSPAMPSVQASSGLRFVAELGVGLTAGLWSGTPVKATNSLPMGSVGLLAAGVALSDDFALLLGDRFVYAPSTGSDGNYPHNTIYLALRWQSGANTLELGAGFLGAYLVSGSSLPPESAPTVTTASGPSGSLTYSRLFRSDMGYGLSLEVARPTYTSYASGLAQNAAATLIELSVIYFAY